MLFTFAEFDKWDVVLTRLAVVFLLKLSPSLDSTTATLSSPISLHLHYNSWSSVLHAAVRVIIDPSRLIGDIKQRHCNNDTGFPFVSVSRSNYPSLCIVSTFELLHHRPTCHGHPWLGHVLLPVLGLRSSMRGDLAVIRRNWRKSEVWWSCFLGLRTYRMEVFQLQFVNAHNYFMFSSLSLNWRKTPILIVQWLRM